MKAYPDRIMGFCVVNPKDGINALREVKRCLEAGMVGVGELDPYGQRFRLDDEYLLKICNICVDYDVPISLYISEPVGEFYFGKSNVPLNDYVNLIIKKPSLKVILPHWGGGLPFYELMPDLKRFFSNVYYDMAASPLLCKPQIYENTINIIGDEKILFGSNFPLILYPDKQSKPDFANFLTELKTYVLDELKLNNILGANFLRLLGRKGEECNCLQEL
jgi:predicted TIM-barrel fold metal-dependent hydrolase